jgi:hypothetical protein
MWKILGMILLAIFRQHSCVNWSHPSCAGISYVTYRGLMLLQISL